MTADTFTTFTTTWTYDKKGNWLMSKQDREDRRELRHELYIELHDHPELAKTKAGQKKAVSNVLARRKSAGGIDPVKLKRWLQILKELLPLILKLFA